MGAWVKGSVKGKLYNQGWGAEMGFPGIVLDDQGDKIDGFVFTSENFPKHWSGLDAFEGNAYARVETTVKLENGTFVNAYIYCLKLVDVS